MLFAFVIDFRFKLDGVCGELDIMEDLSWIPNLENLEELNLSNIGLSTGPYDEHLKIFYDNPMKRLKRLKITRSIGLFESPVFLMKLHKTFPILETLVYKGYDLYQGCWTFGTFLPILQSLSKVKNLHLTDALFDLGRMIQPYEYPDAIFELALEIINNKFPKHSTDLLIREREHGFWLMKNKGKRPELKKELEEGHHTGLSIDGFSSAGPGRGAILHTMVGEKIHLNLDTINQMLDVCK
jgi:hypothetical protein